MAGPIVVFLGPSLPVEEARSLLDARFLPPAQAGDVFVALRLRPRAIGLVDGLFDRVASVWHKELLYAMESGVRVAGASSMGALRAAELETFGMTGIGDIYHRYRSGECRDDDEVALLHADESFGYRPVTEPLVNVRATVARALREGILPAARARDLLEAAKRRPYPERRWDALAAGPGLGEFRRFLEGGGAVDQKAIDARALLRFLAAERRSPSIRPKACRTLYFRYLQHESLATPFRVDRGWLPAGERAARAASGDPSFPFLRLLVRLLNLSPGPSRASRRELDDAEEMFRRVHAPELDDSVRPRLRRLLVRAWAALDRRLRAEGVEPAPEDFQHWVDVFRRERGLESRAKTLAWLKARGLGRPRLGDLLASLYRLRFLLKNPPAGLRPPRLDLSEGMRLCGWRT